MTLQKRVLNDEFARERGPAYFSATLPVPRGTSLNSLFQEARTRSADAGIKEGGSNEDSGRKRKRV